MMKQDKIKFECMLGKIYLDSFARQSLRKIIPFYLKLKFIMPVQEEMASFYSNLLSKKIIDICDIHANNDHFNQISSIIEECWVRT